MRYVTVRRTSGELVSVEVGENPYYLVTVWGNDDDGEYMREVLVSATSKAKALERAAEVTEPRSEETDTAERLSLGEAAVYILNGFG